MQKNKTHEDLIAWQKGHQLTLDIFRTVNDVDPILFEFMKESALRIVSKIAEGISKFDLTTKLKDLEDEKENLNKPYIIIYQIFIPYKI